MKQKIIARLKQIETSRELEKRDIRHLESLIDQISHLLLDSPYSSEEDISSILENFTVDSDGKLKSARSSPGPIALYSSSSGGSRKGLTPSLSSHNFVSLLKNTTPNSNSSSHSDLSSMGIGIAFHTTQPAPRYVNSLVMESISSSSEHSASVSLADKHPMVSMAVSFVNDLKV